MITVQQAEKIIGEQAKDYGTEEIYFEDALGRVLAQDLLADRDLPPYNRVTMDGIAINYNAFENGIRTFNIVATQAAGDVPLEINSPKECIEIMTGAALPSTTDTVIRYEDLTINNGTATINTESLTRGQSVHYRGKDKQKHEVVAAAGQLINPALVNMAAAVGQHRLTVKKLPKVVIISSGDELVEVTETPTPFQIRRSNNYNIRAALKSYCINAHMLHIPDNADTTRELINNCLKQYDVLILSGGISMGKFDYIPQALEDCDVEKLFHKVQQRPGKPFWFGRHASGPVVFALPGNPVSTFMCLRRYFIPWLEKGLGIQQPKAYAILDKDYSFNPPLQYFLQVKLQTNEEARLVASPVEGNGSGDFANLLDADAFMELPLERNNFTKGEIYEVWKFGAV